MTSDLEKIQEIANAAIDKNGNELVFAFPEVFNVIRLCTINRVAVLGVEIFLIKDNEYYASGCSDYDLTIMQKWNAVNKDDWEEYVRKNNTLAEEFIRQNPAGDDHVYILTNASWREFWELHNMKGR